MQNHPIKRACIAVALFVLALAGSDVWATMPDRPATEIISANALLRQIHENNPTQAVALASEARRLLTIGEGKRGRRPDIQLEFRGAPADPPTDQIIRDHRKDFDENPILREIYSRSPLASLRMLKRLREAAKKAN